MDGTLLNTEDLYTEAANDILAEHGKGPLTWDIKIKLQGLPGPEASKIFIASYDLPYTPEELFAKTSGIQKEKWTKARWLPGALELVQWAHENEIPKALATSSATLNYERKTAHLRDGFDLFGEHVVTGDDKRIPAGKGKPHGEIWHVALGSLNQERRAKGLEDISIEDCLVFEDGVPGVISGKNAGAHVVWIPHPQARTVLPEQQVNDLISGHTLLETLEEFDRAKYNLE